MGKQVKVNLTIDEDVVKAAKELGLNMSKISENALKEYIKRLTKPKTMTNGGNPSFSLSEGSLSEKEKVHWWAGPDSNRRPSPREGDVLWPLRVNQLDHRPFWLF